MSQTDDTLREYIASAQAESERNTLFCDECRNWFTSNHTHERRHVGGDNA